MRRAPWDAATTWGPYYDTLHPPGNVHVMIAWKVVPKWMDHAMQGPAQTEARQVDAEVAQVDADLASELIASGVTTQPIETVIAVLAASHRGASINAAATASGINYRTARRIVEAATVRRQPQFAAVG